MPLPFSAGQRLLFQGDSVTDAQRSREAGAELRFRLGHGYVFIIASLLDARLPELGLSFLNRGISGHRAKDLVARWQSDCLNLAPDWVSILVGINDVWRRYDSEDPTSAEDYEQHYRSLLEPLHERGSRLILCEPFLAPVNTAQQAWFEDLDPKLAVVRRLAEEFAAILVPFQSAFTKAMQTRPAAFWAHDGVHPTHAGYGLMAETWLSALEKA